MMDVVVFLGKAVLCFAGTCHPVLVGADTPAGTFKMQHRQVISEGYGGDVLVFEEDATSWLAVHRTYKNEPSRIRALAGPPAGRRYVSQGCINLEPDIYQALVDCCSEATMEIRP